jgi:hypothetical protein
MEPFAGANNTPNTAPAATVAAKPNITFPKFMAYLLNLKRIVIGNNGLFTG